jgi:hypothetical protein
MHGKQLSFSVWMFSVACLSECRSVLSAGLLSSVAWLLFILGFVYVVVCNPTKLQNQACLG